MTSFNEFISILMHFWCKCTRLYIYFLYCVCKTTAKCYRQRVHTEIITGRFLEHPFSKQAQPLRLITLREKIYHACCKLISGQSDEDLIETRFAALWYGLELYHTRLKVSTCYATLSKFQFSLRWTTKHPHLWHLKYKISILY